MPNAPEPKEIRERYADYLSEWQDIRDEAKKDMLYVAGDPWDEKDRQQRADAGRPCISTDEINQYLNQYINNLRQNKRAIKVSPKGFGANDQQANLRGDIIRGIERRSMAPSAYITAAENAASRSYGFWGIKTGYAADDVRDDAAPDSSLFEQEIIIYRIANPDSVLIAPDYKNADASDMSDAFQFELLRKADFKRKYPKAQLEGWRGEDDSNIDTWMRDTHVMRAAFWMVHKKPSTLYLVDGGDSGPIVLRDDEIKTVDDKSRILKKRQAEQKEVIQYITNGVEILDEIPWAGSRVPIIPCFGKEIWVDEGAGARRQLISMVRLARDPQMLLAYFVSQQCEEAGQTPKTPFIGYKGQFESDRETWETLTKIPHAFAQIDPAVDAVGGQVLPPPTRPQFVPNFQQYEIAKDSARRAIQAAMGITPLPTAAQRNSEKSGVALEKIQNQESIGSFHFTDNFDMALGNCGWQVNELIKPIVDTARDVPAVDAKGQDNTVRVNDEAYTVQNPDAPHLHTDKGEFGVTIDDGPSYESQRQEASQFVDLIVQNLKNLPVPPQVAAKILAIAIKLKEIGPMGEEMSDLLDPQNGDPQSQLQQAAVQNQQLQQQMQELQQELQKLQLEKAGKVIDNQGKMAIAQQNDATRTAEADKDRLTKIEVAEIMTKFQNLNERMTAWEETQQLLMKNAHEVAMQAHQQGHEQSLADQSAAQAQNQQQTQIAADQQAQEAQPQGTD